MRSIFVTGIGTGVGKTVVSAVLLQALGADYWKPIQSGTTEGSDTELLKRLVSRPECAFHAEAYALAKALSPHAAAEAEGVRIELQSILTPQTENLLVIEGAGGILVPLNEEELMIDLIEQLGSPVLVVSRHYLGSINHSLLTLEALQARRLPILGIVFVGDENPGTERAILHMSNCRLLGRVPEQSIVNQAFIEKCAKDIEKTFHEALSEYF